MIQGFCHPLFIAAVLGIINMLVFWPAGEQGFFTLDDNGYVSGNSKVLSGLNSDSIRWAFTAMHEANWHPLTWCSHMTDIELFGPDPHRHHLTSVVLHSLNGALLLLLLNMMTGSLWRSVLVAVIFSLHPLRVESVAWIAERKDIVCGLFFMLTLIAYCWYAAKPGRGRYLLALAFFACGLMAKPMLVTLPFLLLLLDYWPLGRWPSGAESSPESVMPKLLREKVPFLLLSLLSSIITFQAQQIGGAVATIEVLPLVYRLENALVSYASYLEKALWPSALAVFYPLSIPIPTWRIVGSVMLLMIAGTMAFKWRHHRPWLAVGWLWYVGMLIPVIGIVHVGLQSMADRYTYLPMIGIAIMLVWSIPAPETRVIRFTAISGGVLLTAALAMSSRAQLAYWRDNVSLFRHTVAVTSDNHLAECYLGDTLFEQGKNEEAIQHYNRSLLLKPYQPNAHNGLGMAFGMLGKLERASIHYNAALKLRPTFVEAHYNLGVIMMKEAKYADADEHFRAALKLRPNFSEARYAQGIVLARQGKIPEAREAFTTVLHQIPKHEAAGKALQLLDQVKGTVSR
jgi:tetratricopeptide (TPR) repeat protein